METGCVESNIERCELKPHKTIKHGEAAVDTWPSK